MKLIKTIFSRCPVDLDRREILEFQYHERERETGGGGGGRKSSENFARLKFCENDASKNVRRRNDRTWYVYVCVRVFEVLNTFTG